MASIGSARMLIIFAAIVSLPALGQSARPNVRWDGLALKPTFVLAAADTGGSGDGSTAAAADQDKKTSQPPTEPPAADNFFGIRGSTGLFGGSDPSSSLGQQAATAGYELRGSGGDAASYPGSAMPLTGAGRGAAIVFDNGIYLYPSLFAGIGHNDNLLSGPATAALVSSSVLNLVPGVVAEMKTHGDRYTLSYLGNYSRYASSSIDDYDHHDLFLAGDNTFTNRTHLGWKVGYLNNSDPRGATDRPSLPGAGPDLWHSSNVSGTFAYGAAQATGRLELETSLQDKRYLTNRLYTASSDADIAMVSGRFFYRVMPKTSLVFEVRNTHYYYIQDTLSNDNTERRYYVGVTWQATAATSGTFKVGRLNTDFTAVNHADYSGASWEGGIRWSPLTYSTVDFTTSKSTANTTSAGSGSYVLNTSTNVMWNHKWASYIASRVSLGLLTSDYVGANRKDDTKTYGLGFFHDLNRRLRAGFDWTLTDRSSVQNIYEFKRNVVMFSLEGTL